jgi:hypothetical protein
VEFDWERGDFRGGRKKGGGDLRLLSGSAFKFKLIDPVTKQSMIVPIRCEKGVPVEWCIIELQGTLEACVGKDAAMLGSFVMKDVSLLPLLPPPPLPLTAFHMDLVCRAFPL